MQPSAGAAGVHIPECPIQPVHSKGEGGNATNSDGSLYYRWDNIVISGETSVADESNAQQFSSTAVPDDGDCIAEDLYCGKSDGMGDCRRDPSGGARIFRVGYKSRILKGGARIFSGESDRVDSDGRSRVLSGGARIFDGKPQFPQGGASKLGYKVVEVDGDGITSALEVFSAPDMETDATSCDSDNDNGDSDFDVLDACNNGSVGSKGGSGKRCRPELPPGLLRHLNCIQTVQLYKRSGGLRKLRMYRRRRLRFTGRLGREGCDAAAVEGYACLTSEGRDHDQPPSLSLFSGLKLSAIVVMVGMTSMWAAAATKAAVTATAQQQISTVPAKGSAAMPYSDPEATALSTAAITLVMKVEVTAGVVTATLETISAALKSAAT